MTRQAVTHRFVRGAAHCVAYLALLAGLLAFTNLDVGWNLDDGAYAIQAKVLDHSSDWAYPYRHADVDPGSRWSPVSHSEVTEQGSYPFVRFPAWIRVQTASRWVFGDVVGLYVPSVLGAVGAALCAGLLARRLRPGTFTYGFWAVALGPVVVHSQALWAHTWLAALGGVVALLLVGPSETTSIGIGRWCRWAPVALAVTSAAAVMLRRDGLLLVASAALVGFLACLVASPASRAAGTADGRGSGGALVRLGRAAWWGVPALGLAAAAYLANQRWVGHLMPGEPPIDGPGPVDTLTFHVNFLEARVRGALRTFVDGVGSASAGTVLGLMVIGVAAVAGRAIASQARRVDGLVLLGLAVALTAVRTAVAPSDLSGLLVAVPVLVVGAAALTSVGLERDQLVLVAHVITYAALVVATQHPEGGSRDWGGRFLFPILVPATVLAVLALVKALEGWVPKIGAPSVGRPARQVGIGLVGVIVFSSAVPTVAGLVAANDLRSNNEASTRAALATGAPTVIRMPRYLTRVSWRALPEQDWLSAADPADAEVALRRLRPQRRDPVAVMGPDAEKVSVTGYDRRVVAPTLVVFTPTDPSE